MHRTVKWPWLLAIVSVCAWADPPPVPDSKVPIPVKYKVTKAQGADAVLLAGVLAVEPFRAASAEHKGRADEQWLSLEVEPLEDGRVLVKAQWKDRTAEGEEVRWQPMAVLKRGADAELRVDFPGGARVLHLTAG